MPRIPSKFPPFRYLFLILLMLSGCATTPPSAVETIQWKSLETGMAEASRTGRPVMVDFFAGPVCHRCTMIEKEVYSNPEMAARILRDFIPVRIDLSKPLGRMESALADRMGTGGECMLLFLKPDGAVVSDGGGKGICTMSSLTPAEFGGYMDRALGAMGR